MPSLIKKKRATGMAKGRFVKEQALMLTTMLDILCTILFFLLKNYTSAVSEFSIASDISLPRSSAIIPPTTALQLVVTRTHILLDGKEITVIQDGKIPRAALHKDGVTILALAQALDAHKQKYLYVQKQTDKSSFIGTIVLQADKDLKFDLLKRVIFTAGIRDFVMLKLAVMKKDAA